MLISCPPGHGNDRGVLAKEGAMLGPRAHRVLMIMGVVAFMWVWGERWGRRKKGRKGEGNQNGGSSLAAGGVSVNAE